MKQKVRSVKELPVMPNTICERDKFIIVHFTTAIILICLLLIAELSGWFGYGARIVKINVRIHVWFRR